MSDTSDEAEADFFEFMAETDHWAEGKIASLRSKVAELEADNEELRLNGNRAMVEWKKAEDKATKLESDVARKDEALNRIANRVNNEGDDSQACVSDVGQMARTALASDNGAWLKRKLAEANCLSRVLAEIKATFPHDENSVIEIIEAEAKRLETEA